eukprot:CFRG3051T1
MSDLSKATKMVLHTGNVLKMLPTAATMTTDKQLLDGIKKTLSTRYDVSTGLGLCPQANDVTVVRSQFCECLPDSADQNAAIKAKLFLADGTIIPSVVCESIKTIENDFGNTRVKHLFVSRQNPKMPSSVVDEVVKSLDHLRKEKRIESLGLSDFDTASIAELIEETGVIPDTAQVNVAATSLSKEMVEFGKKHNIEFVAHIDPPVIITSDELTAVLQEELGKDIGEWRLRWVLRISVYIEHRAMITFRGYVVFCDRI